MGTAGRVRTAARWRVRKAARLLKERRARRTLPAPRVITPQAPPVEGIRPVAWDTATFPQPPDAEFLAAQVRLVPDALLTRTEQGPVNSPKAPKLWLRGAVHEGAALVRTSCRVGGLNGEHIVSVDPRALDAATAASEAERLDGTWVYGGHWMHHFGHFMVETLTSLWPTRADLEAEHGPITGLVFHRFTKLEPVHEWQATLLAASGYGDLPIRVVDAEPLRVERLVVPGRTLAINGWALPEAAQVWRRIAHALAPAAPAAGRRVYLSRARFMHKEHQSGRNLRVPMDFERAVDVMMAARGFEVVHPETLPIAEQVAALAGAVVVAGRPGSQLHLSIYASSDARVVTLGDARSPYVPMPAQRVLDAVCGQQAAFVPYTTDMTTLTTALDDLGL